VHVQPGELRLFYARLSNRYVAVPNIAIFHMTNSLHPWVTRKRIRSVRCFCVDLANVCVKMHDHDDAKGGLWWKSATCRYAFRSCLVRSFVQTALVFFLAVVASRYVGGYFL